MPFEARWMGRTYSRCQEWTVDDLERVLPKDLIARGNPCGNEFVFPFDDALQVIRIATQHDIAVLGLEAFEIRKEGLLTVDLTGYDRDIPFAGNWKEYVAAPNTEAERWIKEHPYGENHGYILTTASQAEYLALPGRPK
jgi:hypothetical protein